METKKRATSTKAALLNEAAELLKEFAFVRINEPIGKRCSRARRVQEFLRKAGEGEWLDRQIEEKAKAGGEGV